MLPEVIFIKSEALRERSPRCSGYDRSFVGYALGVPLIASSPNRVENVTIAHCFSLLTGL